MSKQQDLPVVRDSQQVQGLQRSTSIVDVIREAVQDRSLDVTKMRELFELQKDFMKMQAEQAFAEAFNKLQAELPMVEKNGKNSKGQSFATYEDAMIVVGPLLAKHGFSVTVSEDGAITEYGIPFVLWLKHVQGHKEPTRRTFPMDKAAIGPKGPIRGEIQDAGSTTTYARRYLLFQALNIVAKGEDADGENIRPIPPEFVFYLKSLMIGTGTSEENFLKVMANNTPRVEDILMRDYNRLKMALEAKGRLQKGEPKS